MDQLVGWLVGWLEFFGVVGVIYALGSVLVKFDDYMCRHMTEAERDDENARMQQW